MPFLEIKLGDMEKLAKATGAKIVHILDNLKSEHLGIAGLVEERKIGQEKMILIEECKDPRAVSILVRAGLDRGLDEAERALKHALHVLNGIIKRIETSTHWYNQWHAYRALRTLGWKQRRSR